MEINLASQEVKDATLPLECYLLERKQKYDMGRLLSLPVLPGFFTLINGECCRVPVLLSV